MDKATVYLIIFLLGMASLVVGLFWMIFGAWRKDRVLAIIIRIILVLLGAGLGAYTIFLKV